MATVLVVDDVEMFRNVVVRALEGAGHQALSAPEGRAALALLERTRVDLILLDMSMPTMGGAEFLKRLRADKRHEGIPLVVVSAMSQAPGEQSVLEMGAQAHLLKSRFSLRDLVQRVNELLNVAA